MAEGHKDQNPVLIYPLKDQSNQLLEDVYETPDIREKTWSKTIPNTETLTSPPLMMLLFLSM